MRETLAQSPRRGPVRAARARSSRPRAALAGVLLSYLKVAILEPQLRKWTSRTTFVLKNVAILEPQLRKWTSRTTFVLKVSIFELQRRNWTSRTTFVLESCDFRASCESGLHVLLSYLKVAPAADVDFAYYFRT